MRRIGVSAALFAASMICVFSGSSYPGDKKTESQAKEVAGQFAKAVKAKDLDQVMKLVDVPWADDLNKDGVIKDREVLKKHFEALLKDVKPEEVSAEIVRVTTWLKVRDKVKNETIRKMLDEVISKDDLAVQVGEKRRASFVLVRVREGKAKIVGAAAGALPD